MWLKSKRQMFVLVSILLSLGLLAIQQLPVDSRYIAIAVFAVCSYAFTAWALFKDLRGWAWIVNLILPTLYPVSVALFYFLLPAAAVTRWIVVALFSVSMYALLLTANIFAVASIRTIQLLRAARAVGFLLSVLASAFLFHVIFSLRVGVWLIAPMTLATSFLMLLQGVWSYGLGEKLSKELIYALVGALVMTEIATVISFWLIDIPLASVMLAMAMYVLLGFFQHNLEERLFARTVQEYLGFAGIVFAVVTAAVIWRWMN